MVLEQVFFLRFLPKIFRIVCNRFHIVPSFVVVCYKIKSNRSASGFAYVGLKASVSLATKGSFVR